MSVLLVLETKPSRRLVLRRFLTERGFAFRLGDWEDLRRSSEVAGVILDPDHLPPDGLDEALRSILARVPVIWIAPPTGDSPDLPDPLAVLDPPMDLSALAEAVDSLGAQRAGLPPADTPLAPQDFVAEDPAARQMLEDVDRLAAPDVSVLLRGESGTGKEILARRLHERSPRSTQPFLAVHCGAIPAELLESELFGHEKGAFTDAHRQHRGPFERAGAGTVFLDEIGEMPLELQPKLLRVLENRELTRVGGETVIPVRARVVTATHRDLVRAIEEGWFRRDLYHRLAVATVEIPPLRDRPADLRILTRRFLRGFAEEQGVPARPLSPEVWRRFQAHPWPGNVRELENVLRRAVLLQRGPTLEEDQFPGVGTVRSVEDSAWAAALDRWLGEQDTERVSPARIRRVVREEVDRILSDWRKGEEERPDSGEETS